MLLGCLKTHADEIEDVDIKFLEKAYKAAYSKNPNEYEAGLDALTKYHADVITEMNVVLKGIGKPPVTYTEPKAFVPKPVAETVEAKPTTDAQGEDVSIKPESEIQGDLSVTGETQTDKTATTPKEDVTPEANVRSGKAAINKVLETQGSVVNAMYRQGVGEITFDYGHPGDPNRNYKKGYGISHVVARRGLTENLKVDDFLNEMVETIATGEISQIYGTAEGGNPRVNIEKDGLIVSLSQERFGQKETWLISGSYKKGSADDPAGDVNPNGPTQKGIPFTYSDLGAALKTRLDLSGPENKPSTPPDNIDTTENLKAPESRPARNANPAEATQEPLKARSDDQMPEPPVSTPEATTAYGKDTSIREENQAKSSKTNENVLDTIRNADGEVNYERVKDVAGRVLSGELTIERLDPEGERGRIAGGQRNVEASIILTANERASEEAGSRIHPVKRQERALETYAKQADIWFDEKSFVSQQRGFIKKGVEAYVHRADEESVYKLVDYKMIDRHATPLDFIDNRISLFNHLFPETAYELAGFMRGKDGTFRFVVKQRFIRDVEYTSPVERQAFMRNKGFAMTDKYGESFANTLYKVSDLHEKNALKDPTNGNIYVIDAVPKLTDAAQSAIKPLAIREAKSEPTPTAVKGEGASDTPFTKVKPVIGKGVIGETKDVAAVTDRFDGVTGKPLETLREPANGEPSSIMNREVDAVRENRGWSKLSKKLKLSNEDLHSQVKDIIAKDPEAPLKTFEKFKHDPEGVPTKTENVLLNAHYLNEKQNFNDVYERSAKAIDSADPLELSDAKMARKLVDAKLDEAEQILRRTGTETGGALQSRQMFADEDFEFTRLYRDYKVRTGREPNNVEISRLQSIADEHKVKTETLEILLAGKDQELADIREHMPPRHVLDVAEAYVSKLNSLANKERERLRSRGNVFQAGVDPRDLKSYAIIGADHLANMSLDLAKWSAKMKDEFGEKIEPHLSKIFEEAQKVLSGGHAELKSTSDKISSALKGQKTRMANRIKELENAIEKRERIARIRKISSAIDPELASLKQRVASLKEEYDAIFPGDSRPPMSDAQRLHALEKRLEKKQKAIQDKVANGDLSERPKRETLDPLAIKQDQSGKYTTEDKLRATRIMKARAEVGKIEKRYARMKSEADRTAEPKTKWVQRKATNFVRGSMLSAITVIEKLGAASIGRTITRPIKTTIGYGVSKVIPGIARRAAIEGSKGLLNDLKIEGNAIAKAYTTGVMDIGRTISGKGSDISNAYGKTENYLTSGRYLPLEASQLIGLMHDSLKAPAFRSDFEGVLGNLIVDFKRNNPNVPLDNETMFVLGQRAYQYAQRTKFGEKRWATTQISNTIRKLDNNELTAIQAIGTFLHILMPIHKISTNVVAQSFESSPLGLGKGIVKAVAAKYKGLDSLTSDQADVIMRNIKNGTFGSAMYALGLFAGGKAIGSFYQKYDKDDDKNQAKYNTVQIDGYRIPAALLHLPEFNSMFMGATTKRLYEEAIDQTGTHRYTKTEAALRAVGRSAGDLLTEAPGFDAAGNLINIYHAILGGEDEQMRNSRYGIGNFIAGRTVPGIVRNVAEWGDQDPQGHYNTPFTKEPLSRKIDTETFGTSIKTQFQKGIPVWRKRLPRP